MPKTKPVEIAEIVSGGSMTTFVPVSHALSGTIDERLRACDQIATYFAGLGLNGWDTVQKCKAGFWLADGSGEHPAVFYQNHYVMVIRGRLTIEPKWEYMVRKLKETVPGFRFRVDLETDDIARVTMSDGLDSHTVEYTVDDAKRQGLFGRGENMWTTGSSREGCFKQAVKRAARRIGAGRSYWVDVDNLEMPDAPLSPTSIAEEVVAEEPAPAPARENRVAELSAELVRYYRRKLPKSEALKKASIIYNQMVKEETGVDPKMLFSSVEAIGPIDAERMTAWLRKKDSRPAEPLPQTEIEAPEAAPAPPDDAPPPMELPDDDPSGTIYERFVEAVGRSRKVLGRKFLVEGPPGSGRMYFNDQVILSKAGDAGSVRVFDNGEVIASDQKLQAYTRLMIEACNEKERGR